MAVRGDDGLPGLGGISSCTVTNMPALSRPSGLGIDGAKLRGPRVGIDRLVDVIDLGVDRSIGEREDDLQFLADLDLSASSSLTLPRTQRWSSGAIVIKRSAEV